MEPVEDDIPESVLESKGNFAAFRPAAHVAMDDLAKWTAGHGSRPGRSGIYSCGGAQPPATYHSRPNLPPKGDDLSTDVSQSQNRTKSVPGIADIHASIHGRTDGRQYIQATRQKRSDLQPSKRGVLLKKGPNSSFDVHRGVWINLGFDVEKAMAYPADSPELESPSYEQEMERRLCDISEQTILEAPLEEGQDSNNQRFSVHERWWCEPVTRPHPPPWPHSCRASQNIHNLYKDSPIHFSFHPHPDTSIIPAESSGASDTTYNPARPFGRDDPLKEKSVDIRLPAWEFPLEGGSKEYDGVPELGPEAGRCSSPEAVDIPSGDLMYGCPVPFPPSWLVLEEPSAQEIDGSASQRQKVTDTQTSLLTNVSRVVTLPGFDRFYTFSAVVMQ